MERLLDELATELKEVKLPGAAESPGTGYP